MYTRMIAHKLLESLEESPVLLLNGARQTGKSTLVKTLLADTHTYYTLDDLSVLNIVKSDPVTFLESQPKPIIIDEIQRAPTLFTPLKQMADRKRTPGQFVLTGSANVLSLPQLSESLAGRMEIHTLWPLSQVELHHQSGNFIDQAFNGALSLTKSPVASPVLMELILSGGYPDVVKRTTESKRNNWCASYLQTLLQRDVRDLAHVERLTELPKLLHLLAARVGNLLNTSELSRSGGLPNTTLKRYLSLLETLYLYVTLPPWSGNLSKRLVKAPKLYLNDTRLLGYLLGMNQAHMLAKRAIFGHVLENFVVMELKKQQTWATTRTGMYHYRTHAGEEIDIILEAFNGDVVAIEVKATQIVGPRDFKHLRNLQHHRADKNTQGFVMYMGQEVIPFAKDLTAIPIANLWKV
ncbi:MAG: ATP-binding protein [Roseivirga sp.]